MSSIKRLKLSNDIEKFKKQKLTVNDIDSTTNLSKCFHKIKSKMYISLSPKFLNNPIEGIKQQHLDPLLMTYFNDAKGVILSYSNIEFSKRNLSDDGQLLGTIKFDTPFAFLWISVELLVWRPVVGDLIKGFIYMQTPSHLGLLVHDTFNANIKKYYIPDNWEFVPVADDEAVEDVEDENNENNNNNNNTNVKSLGYWIDENGVKVEGDLQFTVRAIHSAGKFVSIEGTLIKNNNNINDNVIVNSHKKFIDFDEEYQDTSLTVIPEPVKEDLDDLIPKYDDNDDSDDEKIIAQADSSEDEEDND